MLGTFVIGIVVVAEHLSHTDKAYVASTGGTELTVTALPMRDHARYLTEAKKPRRSSTNNAGCSKAAKWPPFGMVVHRVML